MKKLLLIILLGSSSLAFSGAADPGNCPKCEPKLRGVATLGGALGDFEDIVNFQPDYIRKVKNFTSKLCLALVGSGAETAKAAKNSDHELYKNNGNK